MEKKSIASESSSQAEYFGVDEQPHFRAISFNHNGLLKQPSGKIYRKKFINAVNHIHFEEGQLFAHMRHQSSGEEFLVRVSPEPCQGPDLRCRFDGGFPLRIQDLVLRNLLIDDGKSITCMPAYLVETSRTHVSVMIGERGFIFNERQFRRFHSMLVNVRLKQGSREVQGALDDFSSQGFRVSSKDNGLAGLDPRDGIEVELYRENALIYSGMCRLIRTEENGRAIALSPHEIQRTVFKRRKRRNPRLTLIPTPKISCAHPLSKRKVTYEISDITTSGFSIIDNADGSLLIPGLIIRDVSILFAGNLRLRCDAQVVHSQKVRKNLRRFGIAIIDMDMATYSKLFDIVSNAEDIHANFTNDISMEALWEFFFETGFIYPKKYLSLYLHKEAFKRSYETLYKNGPDIFGYFTYQKNGTIYGHASIIKAYHRTWMIHHLAAKPLEKKRTGLFVLKHILNYFDGLYRMPAVGMDYMIFYFRPENKFPDYFFGGFCRELNNPKACSIDRFAYLTCDRHGNHGLPEGWKLEDATSKDVDDLTCWYDRISGGLMMRSFCLAKGGAVGASVEEMYARVGLRRSYSLVKLTFGTQTKAYLLIDESDVGINLSDLLNSVKVFVTDGKDLAWDTLSTAIRAAAGKVYPAEKFPVLVYPMSYVEQKKVAQEKTYNLWALDSLYGDDYSEHLKAKARFSLIKFGIGYLKKKFLRK